MSEAVKEAWADYFATRNLEARDILVRNYLVLVKQITRPFRHKKPFLLDYDDLVQAGTIGLMQAIERYDDEKGVKFETFAQLRIRGAILDEINSLDWTPRSVRKNIRNVIKAEEKILICGDDATPEKLGEETGLTVDEVKLAQQQAARTFVLPVNQESLREIEAHLTEDEAERVFSNFMDGSGKPNANDSWSALLNDLTTQEKKVILLRFYYDETMAKTAKILKISPNNVSSTQAGALEKLKRYLEAKDED